ncbi:hypothetical protein BDQ17DRAFT_1550881 [Cyathus striatus]|nr:hypothetical protein BDQ17DRAFT_1550881 [Cyathus striatus]
MHSLKQKYQKIEKDFPWYLRLHRHLSPSPIFDRSAVANSATELDLSVLYSQPSAAVDHDTTSGVLELDDGDVEDVFRDNHEEESKDQSDQISQSWDLSLVDHAFSDELTEHQPSSPLVIDVPVPTALATLATPSVPQKRKSPYDYLYEMSTSHRKAQHDFLKQQEQRRLE